MQQTSMYGVTIQKLDI